MGAMKTTPIYYAKLLAQSLERKMRVRQLYKQGLTQAHIAKRMKISRQRVHQILNEPADKKN
jgi:DNA-binding transcriptional regulator LsrR (DeoR family)